MTGLDLSEGMLLRLENNVTTALAGMGIHVEIETVRRTWDWEGTVEEAFEYVEGFLESQSDTEPQPDLI